MTRNKLISAKSVTSAVLALLLMAMPAVALLTPAAADAGEETGSMTNDGKTMDKESSMMEGSKHAAYRGQIANVQLGATGVPEWIQSGIWVLRTSQNEDTQHAVSFIARLLMVAPDGSSAHMHGISRFQVSEYSVDGSTHVITGTARISMPTGTVDDAPVIIRLINDAVIALWIGPEAVSGHFGSDAIFGTVGKAVSGGAPPGQMMEETPRLEKTNLPVTIPLTQGFVDGNEVFYISTEASDPELAAHLTNVTGFRVAYTPALALTPPAALASIYVFSNGIEGSGPLGFQPNVADSQPGDPQYSPLWRINMVEWTEGTTPRTLVSDDEIAAAQSAEELEVTFTDLVVNCPFVSWEGGSLQLRADTTLSDDSPYGGGQLLSIDLEKMEAIFVAHRGFAPDGSTIYYIATDASVPEVADALGVIRVNKTGAALLTGAASDLWVFANGITGTGPMGFQASIASSNVGDQTYSPLWRIIVATWQDPNSATFLTNSDEISEAAVGGPLKIEVAGVVVNCPFVEIN